jgi:WD40 repeat protein
MLGLSGGSLFETPLDDLEHVQHRLVVPAGQDPIVSFQPSADGARIHTWHESGTWQRWSRPTGPRLPGRRLISRADPWFGLALSSDERWLAVARSAAVEMWDLAGPAAQVPLQVRTGARPIRLAIDPTNEWMAVQDSRSLFVWPLTRRHPFVLHGPSKALRGLAVDPRGSWIAAGGDPTAAIQVWPLGPDQDGEQAALVETAVATGTLAVSPGGDLLAAGTMTGAWTVPLTGGPPQRLPGFESLVATVAFDPTGRWLAAGGGLLSELMARGETVIRIWSLDTREVRILDAGDAMPIAAVAFLPTGRLVSGGPGGLRLWDLASGGSTLIDSRPIARVAPTPDGRYLLALRAPMRPGGAVGSVFVRDLQDGRSWDLTSHGTEITSIAWHPSGTDVVTGSRDGVVRVGSRTGGEPHLLLGHAGAVWNVQVGPGARWLASSGDDGTVRVWPMPEGQPFHTLPRSDLLARLRSLTNYRVVEDPGSASGYRLDFEPFTGWNREPPTW